MIHQVLLLILNQLEDYISANSGDQTPTPPYVVAGNIGLAATIGAANSSDYMTDKIVVSIVNIIEEATLKNGSPYRSASFNPETERPPVYLNLFLLFTANFSGADASGTGLPYYRGLIRLSQVVEFFQGADQFSIRNAPGIDFLPDTTDLEPIPSELQDVSVQLELVSLTFEQLNYLWGALGGKQLPFVLYKAHVVPITRRRQLGRGSWIEELQTTTLDFSR